jgi:hypothetical protein
MNPFYAVVFPILSKHAHGFVVCMMNVSLCVCNLFIYIVKIDINLNYSTINKVTSSWIY